MDLSSKKKLAARVLGVGESRVRIDPGSLDTVSDAITREGIRGLVSAGLVWAVPVKGISRGRARERHEQRRRRGTGAGRKKGASGARTRNNLWSSQVRVLRKKLLIQKDRGDIGHSTYRSIYKQIKGGQIRTLRRLDEVIRQAGAR